VKHLVVLVGFLISTTARADCPMQVYGDPAKEPNYDCPSPNEDVLVPDIQALPSVELKKGEASPREGILLDRNRVLGLGLRIKALRRLRWMETTSSAKQLQAETAYQQKVAKAKEDLLGSQVESYKKQLLDARADLASAQKWYRSWTFGVVVGIVVTAAGGTALGLALRK